MTFTATGIHDCSQIFHILSPAWKISDFHSKSIITLSKYINSKFARMIDMECQGVLCNSFSSQIFLLLTVSIAPGRSSNMVFSPFPSSLLSEEQRLHRVSIINSINLFVKIISARQILQVMVFMMDFSHLFVIFSFNNRIFEVGQDL